MQNLKRVLRILARLEKEVEKISEKDVEKVIPSDPEEAIAALYEIGSRTSRVVRVLFRVREAAVSMRIKIEDSVRKSQEERDSL